MFQQSTFLAQLMTEPEGTPAGLTSMTDTQMLRVITKCCMPSFQLFLTLSRKGNRCPPFRLGRPVSRESPEAWLHSRLLPTTPCIHSHWRSQCALKATKLFRL